MKKILDLFLTFFKIGLLTFGGGYAMISVIENVCVNKHKWINEDEMKEIIILSESTPGPISINFSTFIGYKVKRFWGAFFATLATALPSLIVILLISIFLKAFKESVFINFLFQGIRASVIILMIQAFFNLFKNGRKNLLFYTLLCSSFILNFFLEVKSIYIILFSIIFSFIYLFVSNNKSEVKENV